MGTTKNLLVKLPSFFKMADKIVIMLMVIAVATVPVIEGMGSCFLGTMIKKDGKITKSPGFTTRPCDRSGVCVTEILKGYALGNGYKFRGCDWAGQNKNGVCNDNGKIHLCWCNTHSNCTMDPRIATKVIKPKPIDWNEWFGKRGNSFSSLEAASLSEILRKLLEGLPEKRGFNMSSLEAASLSEILRKLLEGLPEKRGFNMSSLEAASLSKILRKLLEGL